MPVLALDGKFVFRFSGFDRDNNRARHLVGLGVLQLTPTGSGTGTISPLAHYATNSPISGQAKDLKHATYSLSGGYTYNPATAPPIVASANLRFTQVTGTGRREMTDTFFLVQNSPNSLWLISSNPQQVRDESGSNRPESIEEAVIGELVKVDANTW